MRVEYKSVNESKGLKLASTYYPPQANTINHWSDNLLGELKKDIKPIAELKKELAK